MKIAEQGNQENQDMRIFGMGAVAMAVTVLLLGAFASMPEGVASESFLKDAEMSDGAHQNVISTQGGQVIFVDMRPAEGRPAISEILTPQAIEASRKWLRGEGGQPGALALLRPFLAADLEEILQGEEVDEQLLDDLEDWARELAQQREDVSNL